MIYVRVIFESSIVSLGGFSVSFFSFDFNFQSMTQLMQPTYRHDPRKGLCLGVCLIVDLSPLH